MAIVKSDKWKEALRNHKVVNRSDGIIRRILSCCKKEKDNGTDLEASGESNAYVTQFTTPMRRIIKKMPGIQYACIMYNDRICSFYFRRS